MRFPWWSFAAALWLTALPGCTVSFDFPSFVGVTRWPEVDLGPPSARASLDFADDGRIATTPTFMPYWGDEIFTRAEGLGLGDLDDDGDLDAIASTVGVQSQRAVLLRNDLVESSMRGPFVDETPGAWVGETTCSSVAQTTVYAPPLLFVAPPIAMWPPCAFRQTAPFEMSGLTSTEMPITEAASVVTVGDVTGDGLLDVLLGGGGVAAHWLVSDRDHWRELTGLPVDLSDLAAASLVDLDADRILDLVTVANGPTSGGHVLHGLGGGAFASTADTVSLETRAQGARRIGVVDLDADARTDLALFDIDSTPNTVTFLWNRSSAAGLSFDETSMQLTAVLGTEDAVTVAPGDYDDDGFADLAVTSGGDAIVVLQNRGDGTFSERVFTVDGTNDIHTSSLADVDLDGDLDVLLCWGPTATPISRECGVFANQIDGSDFLEMALRGPRANAHAVGARVVVFPAGRLGDFTARPLVERTVAATSSLRAPTTVHVGLPPTGAFDVRVYWPDGATPTDILSVERGTRLRIVEP